MSYEKHAQAQDAILDRIIDLAPGANPNSIQSLAEAFEIVRKEDYNRFTGD